MYELTLFYTITGPVLIESKVKINAQAQQTRVSTKSDKNLLGTVNIADRIWMYETTFSRGRSTSLNGFLPLARVRSPSRPSVRFPSGDRLPRACRPGPETTGAVSRFAVRRRYRRRRRHQSRPEDERAFCTAAGFRSSNTLRRRWRANRTSGPRPAPKTAHRPDVAGTAANTRRLTVANWLNRTCLADLGKHVDRFALEGRVYAVHSGRLWIVQSEPCSNVY